MQVNYKVQKGETRLQYRARLQKESKDLYLLRKDQLISGELPCTMDVDDFGFLLPGYEDLLRLKKSLPNLKVTLFTIPMSSNFFNSHNAKHFKWESYKKWAKIVNSQDWIEVAFHGFAHVHNECDTSYDKSVTILEATEKLFERVGLKYIKLIKAPYWQMSYDFMVACRDRGYTVAIDKDHMRPIPEGLKTYIFNWSFEEQLPAETPVIKGHGHFTGYNKNNISDTLHNILVELPKDTKFKFVSEYLAENSDSEKIDKIYRKE